ncbi:MAG TPA: STAS domain-containing protein, partial [Pseudomonadota bacterium]|nr:STAS domain-containing protein [Pseudomonadota bacterium]
YLAALVADLEAKVKERTHALTQANEEILAYGRAEQSRKEREVADQREVIEQQKAIIRALSSPIIQIWDGVLTVPLTGMLEADRAVQMMERLLDEIIKTRARYAILDLTGVDVVDTSTADHLVRIIRAIELLGAKAVISGIRSAVAQTMISLGVDLRRIITLRNMRDALRFCMGQQLPAHQ